MLLSLDVGFRNMGWSAIDDKSRELIDCGVIQTRKAKDKRIKYTDQFYKNAQDLFHGLSELVKKVEPFAMIGELPHGGGQNARAIAQMMSAISIVSGVSFFHDLPTEWCTPTDVKMAVTGKQNASKMDIMLAIAKKFEIPIEQKEIGCRVTKKNKNGTRTERRFVFKDRRINEGRFEHIADSCGAYLALVNSPICMIGRNLAKKEGKIYVNKVLRAA